MAMRAMRRQLRLGKGLVNTRKKFKRKSADNDNEENEDNEDNEDNEEEREG